MTKNEIIRRIKQELDDQGVFYTDTDIYDSLDDGYDLIALFTGCITKSVELDITGGLVYYDLSSPISDYYRTLAIFDPNSRRYLEPISVKKLEAIDETWDSCSGTPLYFVPLPMHTVAFYPHYASAPSKKLKVYYEASAPATQDIATFAIPVQNHQVLIDYVVSDLFDQALEINKSSKVWADFQENLARAKRTIQCISMRDRIDQVSAMIYGTMDR